MVRKVATSFLLLLAAASIACMGIVVLQSSFSSTFSLKELVEKHQPNSGLDCSSAGGGGSSSGIGTGAGGFSSKQSNFYKGESFFCQVSDAEQFNEARFIQALKESVEKDLNASDARITSSKNTDATSFSIDYTAGKMSGRVEISGKRSPANYYSFDATLSEKNDL